MPIFAYITLFEELLKRGFSKAHMGGSEREELNQFKRLLGAELDPSYWTVKTNALP